MRGGYREGSGRSKSGYYKGIYCGSTYELAWVIYNLDHQIQFTRFANKLSDGKITYIPDFLLEDGHTIVEIKGYEAEESVNKKTALAESFGYKVIVLRKNDLQHVFDYVTQTYNTKKLYTLYDGYKPAYQYTCRTCFIEFFRDRQIKNKVVYCSKRCSMKGNRQNFFGKQKPPKPKNMLLAYYRKQSKSYYDRNKDSINKRRRELYKQKKTALSSSGSDT